LPDLGIRYMWLSWLGWDGLNHLPEFDVIGKSGWGATNSSKPTLRAGGIRRNLNRRWWAVDRRFGCCGVLRSRGWAQPGRRQGGQWSSGPGWSDTPVAAPATG
jgi:hypothetical protein